MSRQKQNTSGVTQLGPDVAALRRVDTQPAALPREVGGLVITLVETMELGDGVPRSVSLVDVDFEPLDYQHLVKTRLHLPVTVPLILDKARILGTNIEGFDPGDIVSGRTSLESVYSSSAVSLQQGGWLPSALAIVRRGVTVLPDRNVMGQIRSRYNEGKIVAKGSDLLDLLIGHEVRINPILFAIEGNRRAIPTREEVEAQLDEAKALLSRALPQAEVVIGEKSASGATGLIDDTREGLKKKQAFLLELAPLLEPPTSHRMFDARWQQVLLAAENNGVPRRSLVALAALSSIALTLPPDSIQF